MLFELYTIFIIKKKRETTLYFTWKLQGKETELKIGEEVKESSLGRKRNGEGKFTIHATKIRGKGKE